MSSLRTIRVSSRPLPAWAGALRSSLEQMACGLRASAWRPEASSRSFTPEQFGFRPGQKATAAIQRTIDAAAGGGTVLLQGGDYVSGTLVLRSGVSLRISAGSRLLGSTDLGDYPPHHAARLTVQDTSMGMHQSLIFAEGCENISLCGEGVIDGQGGPEHFPGDETAQATPGRPFLMRIIDCRNVYVGGLTLRNAACWMQNYLNCDRVHLENLTVRNHANYNNDGMDLDGCRDVWIHGCDVSSGDDALCFKGASLRPARRVLAEDCRFFSACNAVKVGTDTQGDFSQFLIRNCRIGGLREDPSGLKHAWSDSGISLEMVDGGTLEDFLLTGLTVERAWSPFFLRLENRGRVLPGTPPPPPGALRRILFSGISGEESGPRGSYLMGIPEQPIRDVVFENISFTQRPWTGPAPAEEHFPDFRGAYPDAHMIDPVGPSPACGLWARDTEGLLLSRFEIRTMDTDTRPGLLLPDA